METMSQSASSVPSSQETSSTLDELSMQQSMLFSDSLKDLKNLRSQLYSAAEYFEVSYTNDDHKQLVVSTLKDYAVKAFVNTVDHLGSVSHKVNGLFDEKVDEVSGTELRVSCIEQRLRTCQEYIDHEGLSQQALVITTPKYHKRYILPVGESEPGSGTHVVAHYRESNKPMEDSESLRFQTEVRSTIKDRTPSFRKTRSPSPSTIARSSSPCTIARSSSPSRKMRSLSPPPRPGSFIFSGKNGDSLLPSSKSNPLIRSGSLSIRTTVLNSSNTGSLFPSEPLKSSPLRLHADRDAQKDVEQKPSKSNRFLKALLSRRKSRKDDMLYTFLDEY